MAPAPINPKFKTFIAKSLLDQFRRRSANRLCEIDEVLFLVTFVPRENEHLLEVAVGAGEKFRSIVDGFFPRQRERPTTSTKRLLVAEDLAGERRFLNVSRGRRHSEPAKPFAER